MHYKIIWNKVALILSKSRTSWCPAYFSSLLLFLLSRGHFTVRFTFRRQNIFLASMTTGKKTRELPWVIWRGKKALFLLNYLLCLASGCFREPHILFCFRFLLLFPLPPFFLLMIDGTSINGGKKAKKPAIASNIISELVRSIDPYVCR